MQTSSILSVPFVPVRRGFRDAGLYLFSAAFVAGNLALPMAVHTVPQGGLIFLPLFFFTLVAAYSEGLLAGVLVALASPIINHAVTGMPAASMLPIVLFKSLFLAVTAAAVSGRLKKISFGALVALVLGMQIFGGLSEYLFFGDFGRAVYSFKLGFPGMIFMVVGGHAVLRMIANSRQKGNLSR